MSQTTSKPVGQQAPAPKAAEGEPTKPVLWDDIDPVLVLRTQYDPEKPMDMAAMKAAALATAEANIELGEKLIPAQQEPVVAAPEGGTAHAAPHHEDSKSKH